MRSATEEYYGLGIENTMGDGTRMCQGCMWQWNSDDDDGDDGDDDDDHNNNQLIRENLVHNIAEQLRSIHSKVLNRCNFRLDKFF